MGSGQVRQQCVTGGLARHWSLDISKGLQSPAADDGRGRPSYIVARKGKTGGLKKFGPAIVLRLQAISYAFFNPQSAIRNS
jgi:hypothetical protein